jgi:DNA-binding LacI/PurR family transcriptional regulator
VATIVDVAARAGVGVGTVSRVLNNSPLVSEKTRERVMAVIDELDYRPSQLARNLSLGRTLTIGVITPLLTQAAGHRADPRHRRDVAQHAVRPGALHHRDAVAARRAVPQPGAQPGRRPDQHLDRPNDQEVERFRRAGVPVVLVNGRHESLPCVINDDEAGGAMATRHLISLGHTRIGFIGEPADPYGVDWSRSRQTGYCQALAEAGLPVRDEYQIQGPSARRVTARMTNQLLSLPEPPTAVFVATDAQALAVMEAAEEAGVNVPDDLSVIGFDDIDVARYVGLSTILQPLFESGRRGAMLLLESLQVDTLEASRTSSRCSSSSARRHARPRSRPASRPSPQISTATESGGSRSRPASSAVPSSAEASTTSAASTSTSTTPSPRLHATVAPACRTTSQRASSSQWTSGHDPSLTRSRRSSISRRCHSSRRRATARRAPTSRACCARRSPGPAGRAHPPVASRKPRTPAGDPPGPTRRALRPRGR